MNEHMFRLVIQIPNSLSTVFQKFVFSSIMPIIGSINHRFDIEVLTTFITISQMNVHSDWNPISIAEI